MAGHGLRLAFIWPHEQAPHKTLLFGRSCWDWPLPRLQIYAGAAAKDQVIDDLQQLSPAQVEAYKAAVIELRAPDCNMPVSLSFSVSDVFQPQPDKEYDVLVVLRSEGDSAEPARKRARINTPQTAEASGAQSSPPLAATDYLKAAEDVWKRANSCVMAWPCILKHAQREVKPQLQQVQKAVEDLQHAMNQVQYECWASFGESAARLVQENLDRFSRPPMGPVGQYLEVKDNKWVRAVEAATYATLTSFVCHCSDDQAALQQLIIDHQVVARTSIYVQDHDAPLRTVSDNERPPPGWQTVMDLIGVDDAAPSPHALMNLLMERAAIHRAVLVADQLQGRDVMYKGAAGPIFRCAYDELGTYYKGNTAVKFVQPNTYRGPARLATGQDRRATRRKLQQEQAKLESVQQKLQELHNNLQTACGAGA